MLRKSLRLAMEGERPFKFAGESPMGNSGGLPFYGNVYAGRVDSQNYVPAAQGGSSGLLNTKFQSLWDDPSVRSKIAQCPYFALCDQVIFHNMDPAYLDPGLLSPEEHHLLLLYSRGYYEKWAAIHKKPPVVTPRIRLNYGSAEVLDQILEMLDVHPDVRDVLKKEYSVDDSCLIGMNPDLWMSAYLDPANLDHLSGRVLEFAGLTEPQRAKFFRLLEQMRRIRVVRKDTPTPEEVIVPFREAVTLFDFYKTLGLKPYSGQLKVYDFIDTKGTQLTETLKDEDTFFDYVVALFYKADLRNATLSDVADNKDHTCRYTVTVEPFTVADRRAGRWF